MNLDPMKSRRPPHNYILDLDPMNYADAYFYNAMASYKLNKIEDAEKSALKAEHLDLRTHFPQVHLLLAGDLARKDHYAVAIAQIANVLGASSQCKKTPTTYGPSWQNWKAEHLTTQPPEKLNQR